jgi:O-antigen ligase
MTVPSPLAAWNDARTGPAELAIGVTVLATVAVAVLTGTLPMIALGIAAAVALAAAVLDPRLFLVVYVALIPFDGWTAVGGIATLSRLVGIAFAAGYLIRRRGSLRIDTIGVGGWAFVVYATTSLLWSIDRTSSLPEILTLLQLFAIAVLAADSIAADPGSARWIGLVYAASAVIIAALGTWNWVTNPASLPAGRAAAFAGQDAAQFTAVLIPGLLVLAWEAIRRPRWIVIGAGLVIIVGVLASGTRSAWVAVGLALSAGLVPRISGRQRVGLGILVAATAVVALVVPPLYAATYGRLADAISSGGTGRVDIWTIALGAWTGNPVAGVGYGAFPSALTLEVVRATAIPTPDTGFLTPPIGSHSIIVGTLVELGVLGSACLVAFLWDVVRPRRGDVPLAEMARLAVLAMLVQALFLDILGRKQLWLFIAIAGGLTMASRVTRPAAVTAGDSPASAAGEGSIGEGPAADPVGTAAVTDEPLVRAIEPEPEATPVPTRAPRAWTPGRGAGSVDG